MKSVFLFHFTQFVEWPAASFPESRAPLVIGVLGDDPFGSYLDETIKGETANGRPISIQRCRRVAEASNCHVLFVSRSEAPKLDQILAAVKGRSILTVADIDDFSRKGGIVRFSTDSNKTQLWINPEAAKAANLRISSRLLRLAKIVTSSSG